MTLEPKSAASTVRVTHAAAPVAPAPAQEAAPAKPAAATGESAAAAEPKKAAATGEAFLNINSIPASNVVLDGKPLGTTPRLKVSVPSGAHTVVFVNPELSLKKSVSVTVGAGETKPVIAKLRE